MDSHRKLLSLVEKLEIINEWCGRGIAWLTLLMVIVTFSIVVLRYGFNLGWIAMQESTIYMYALIFLLGIPYTFKHNEHVRVDIFYNQWSQRRKAWVNLFGVILLLIPMTIFIFYSSWDYVLDSWKILEVSGEAGGLSIVFLLKTAILLMAILLLIQAMSSLAGNLKILLGDARQEHSDISS